LIGVVVLNLGEAVFTQTWLLIGVIVVVVEDIDPTVDLE
jgi:hypothetical protein